MKKKIALLLAAIMTMSLMPTTIFASSGNKISRTISSVPAKTALVFNRTGALAATKPPASTNTFDRRNAYDGSIIENYADGVKLSMRIDEGQALTPGTAFRIQLENAKWLMTVASSNSTTSQAVLASTGQDNAAVNASGVATPEYKPGSFVWNTDPNTGYTYVAKPNIVTEVSYKFNVSTADSTVATVTILNPDGTEVGVNGATAIMTYARPWISIPMPMYIEKEGVTVKAKITNNSSEFSSGDYVVVSSVAGSTVNSFKEIKSGRDTIELGVFAIDETRIGSLEHSGAIRLTAPSGYDFANLPNTTGDAWQFLTESGSFTLRDVYFKVDSSSNDVVYIYFDINGVSTTIPGSLYIKNMKISPVDNDNVPFGKTITMNVQKYSGGANDTWRKLNIDSNGRFTAVSASALANPGYELQINTGSINAAKPVDWTVAFTAATPKEIVSGVYTDNDDADEHLTAEVTFEEQEKGAWLADRTTVFTLPAGVKVRGIDFTDTYNINSTLNDRTSHQLDGLAVNTTDSKTQTKYIDTVVTYNENKITLKSVDIIDRTDTARLQFKLYVSVDPNYASDTITLTASGTAIADKLAPITIAKVKRPVTVSAKTTEVQIGYQRYAVGDIKITENVAGAIRKVDTASGPDGLCIALYDGDVASDIQFNTISASQVSVSGDLKVTLKNVSGGVINLDVDRTSTTPSTITISGVEVKVNRNVPYGSFDLDVFGKAVFANYETVGVYTPHLSPIVGFGKDSDGFITKDYIKVGTPGTDTQKVNTFKVQDGSKTVIINGETSTIPVAPYISKTTNRFMLPVRYMAVLLGVDEKDIVYSDATKTVTVMMPTRTIQFVTGSDMLTIASNGVTTQVKMDAKAENTDGRVYVPVKAVADAYGAKLAYDDATKTATFN